MLVKNFELFRVKPRWLFLKIETDGGIEGWGEPTLEGNVDTVETAVTHLIRRYLIGKDPFRIEDHWQTMYKGDFYRGGPVMASAISGIDQALWDIKGKYFNAPVFELLGGRCRDKIRVYSWIGGDEPKDVQQMAAERVKSGYTALKMNASGKMMYIDNRKTLKDIIKRMKTVREEVGDTVDVGVDFHGRVSPAMARRVIKELEPYHPAFAEEPILTSNVDTLAWITKSSPIPIAAGERNYTKWEARAIIDKRAVDILNPDISHAGGILELKKIAAMAEANDIFLSPHCPLGPVALAACVQVDTCIPNLYLQEQSLEMHYNVDMDLLDYLADPDVFRQKKGHINLLTKPGLGIELNESVIREVAKEGHDWSNPVWRHEDGSFADW